MALNDVPDAPWTTESGYDRYRNDFYGLMSDEDMLRLYDYDPERCDGHECYENCDHCPYNLFNYEDYSSLIEEEGEEDADI